MRNFLLILFIVSISAICYAEGDTIEDPFLVNFTGDLFTDTGSTVSFQDDYVIPGSEGDDNDVVYQFTITEHKSVTISLEFSSYNTKLAIFEEGTVPATDNFLVYSNTFWNGSSWVDQSRINGHSLLPGTYVAVIDGEGSTPNGDYQIDITLEDPPIPGLPNFPDPADNAFYVPLDQQLTWNNSNYTAGVEIYFGTDEDPSLIDTFDEIIETYDPGTLTSNTVYYWKVVCFNDMGNSDSEVWSFRSAPVGDPVYHIMERFNSEIPDTWDNDGGWSWIEYYDSWGTHYTIDGTPLIYTDEDAVLITPVIDATGLENLYLEYDEVLADYPPNSHTCEVHVYDGAEWVVAYAHPGGNVGSWYSTANHMQLDLTEYINDQLQVKFDHINISGSWSSYWTLDNVAVSSPSGEVDNPVPPENLFALPNEDDTECLVTWEPPGAYSDYEIAYDDGEETTSSIYFNAGQGSAVRFTPLGYPCSISDALIHVSDGWYGTLPSDFAVVVYDDDGTDGAPGTELAWIDVTANQFFWNEFDITAEEIVIESGDFYLCYMQTGTMMTSLPHPASQNNPTGRSWYVMDSNWSQETDLDNLIRVVVNGPQGERILTSYNNGSVQLPEVSNQKEQITWNAGDAIQTQLVKQFLASGSAAPAYDKSVYELNLKLLEMNSQQIDRRTSVHQSNPYRTIRNYRENGDREMTGYEVWRLEEGDEELPENWDLLAEDIVDTFYVDTGWADLETGLYVYAVKTLYTDDVVSDAAFSNIVAKNMFTDVTFNLNTNSGDSPAGAGIRLECLDNDPDHIYDVEAEGETTIVQDVWRGTYIISIDLTGFDYYEIEAEILLDGIVYNVELIETLSSPIELTAVTAYAEVTLNWLAPGTSTGIYERFDMGVFPPDGWESFELADAGGFELSEENHSAYGNGSAFHGDLNHDCDDWLVSPQVTLTEQTQLSFFEMNQYLPTWYEHHGLWVSTGSGDPGDGDFELVQEFDAPIEEWTEQIVDLSEYSNTPIYIAFKYAGFYATRWYIDDVETGIPAQSRSLLGYNIFRNDIQINDELINATTFTDTDVPTGTYTYSVTAEYTTGTSDPVILEGVEVEGTDADENVIPSVTALQGNYPNPFNPVTTIKFGLQEDSYVTLVIFNSKGQVVTTLVEEEMQAGYRSIIWDGRDLQGQSVSSGVYFYKMQAGKYTCSRKMILMK
jgi:flagellar hook capping protein FlgD